MNRRPSAGARGLRLASAALGLVLVLAPAARPAATGLGPQDMAAMMQGMLAMMKLWNAFTGGSDFSLGGSFSPSSVFQGSQWSDPWTGAAAMSPWSNPWGSALAGGMPWSSPMSGAMPWGGTPGGMPLGGGVPWQGFSALAPMAGGVPGMAAMPGGMPGLSSVPAGVPFGPGAGGRAAGRAPGPLEGRWVGESGDAVEFRGERFRLGGQGRGQVTGTFLVHGDRLVLYVPEGDTTRLYRFERRGEYLALQDDSGQVLLFRASR